MTQIRPDDLIDDLLEIGQQLVNTAEVDDLDGTAAFVTDDDETADAVELAGFRVIDVPPELFDRDLIDLAASLVSLVAEGRPARNRAERAVLSMFADLADSGVKSAPPAALAIGLACGLAQLVGERIPTELRAIAKEAKVRYAVLLKIRKAAVRAFDGVIEREPTMETTE